MKRAQIPIDSDTMYTCFMNGLLKSDYEQEIRDIGLMKHYVREDIVRLVRNRYETLKGERENKESSSMHALVCEGRGNGRRGGG